MGHQYAQLSVRERCEIHRLHAGGVSRAEIGRRLGRATSTITRELKRNSTPTNAWPGGYDALRAHDLALRRRRWDCRFKLERQPALRKLVRDYLAMGWSPQQIAGRLAHDNAYATISHESIYRYVYHRSAQKDYLHRLLPQRKSRRGRLRRGGISPVLHIKQRVPIGARPDVVARRRQPGHWEGDLMCFAKRSQNILVLHERTSRMLYATRLASKAAAGVADRITGLFEQLPAGWRRSITFDNGTEFAEHYKLAERHGTRTYFCDVHAPWQKGGVENAIRRLRRRLPRKSDLALISRRSFDAMIANYNNTPRRCLGYRTPAEVFWNSNPALHFNRETTSRPSAG
jgi:transposase, IS30 family